MYSLPVSMQASKQSLVHASDMNRRLQQRKCPELSINISVDPAGVSCAPITACKAGIGDGARAEMDFTLYPSFACALPLSPPLTESHSLLGISEVHDRHEKADPLCAALFRTACSTS